MSLIWRGSGVADRYKRLIPKALAITGEYTAGVVRAVTPVDLGNLRSSITWATYDDKSKPVPVKGATAKEEETILQPEAFNILKIGTAVEYAGDVEFGTKAHLILPKKKPFLAWKDKEGVWHYASKVNHPGTRRQSFLRLGILGNKNNIGRVFSMALEGLIRNSSRI
jgi:hypothetical protein